MSERHLCWTCEKAEYSRCGVYEEMTRLTDENIDNKKIMFSVPECDDYIESNIQE